MPNGSPSHRAWWTAVAAVLIACVAVGIAAIVLSLKTDGSTPLQRQSAAQTTQTTKPAPPDREMITSTGSDAAVAILSYRAQTVDADVAKAKHYLTGEFLETFTRLMDSTVIPGAKQKNITAKATVTAIGITSATDSSAELLLFVNQATTMGTEAPSEAANSVRMHLVKVGSQWLVDQFEPL
jgi:Mce-associated membrane protein